MHFFEGRGCKDNFVMECTKALMTIEGAKESFKKYVG